MGFLLSVSGANKINSMNPAANQTKLGTKIRQLQVVPDDTSIYLGTDKDTSYQFDSDLCQNGAILFGGPFWLGTAATSDGEVAVGASAATNTWAVGIHAKTAATAIAADQNFAAVYARASNRTVQTETAKIQGVYSHVYGSAAAYQFSGAVNRVELGSNATLLASGDIYATESKLSTAGATIPDTAHLAMQHSYMDVTDTALSTYLVGHHYEQASGKKDIDYLFEFEGVGAGATALTWTAAGQSADAFISVLLNGTSYIIALYDTS